MVPNQNQKVSKKITKTNNNYKFHPTTNRMYRQGRISSDNIQKFRELNLKVILLLSWSNRDNLQTSVNNANETTKTALANYNFQDGSAKHLENLRSNVDNWLSDANKSLMTEV